MEKYSTKNKVFRYVTPCSLVYIRQGFAGTYCFRFQSGRQQKQRRCLGLLGSVVLRQNAFQLEQERRLQNLHIYHFIIRSSEGSSLDLCS